MSPYLRSHSLAVISMIAASCTLAPTEDVPLQFPPNIPDTPAPSEPVGRLDLILDTREAFTDLTLRLQIAAYNTQGRRMNTNLAVVTSSNPGVATVGGSDLVLMQQPNGARTTEIVYSVAMASPGTAVLRVRLGDVTDSTILNVRALPPALNVLAVDSFTVLEYRPCTTCNSLAYAPLLKLREPTGISFADVIAVEFSIPSMTTGLCTTGGLHFPSNLSAHINYIDPYPYANDMFFMSLNGVPVPDGLARARVVVRDGAGNYGLIEATAPIQRMVALPAFPATSFKGVPWSCNARVS